MVTRYSLGASLMALAIVSSAQANLLVNGGLEKSSNAVADQFNLITVAPGGTALPGWSITSGTVDLVPGASAGTMYWQNTEGAYSLDLVGTPGIGGISQSVATSASAAYTLTFDFSVNPQAGALLEGGTTKILRVQAIAANGTTVLATQDFSDTKGTRTVSDMQWAPETFSFTATGATTTLRLFAVTPLNLPSGATSSTIRTGPVIDNLDLQLGGGSTPAPEPASLGVLGLGTAAMLLRRHRKAKA